MELKDFCKNADRIMLDVYTCYEQVVIKIEETHDLIEECTAKKFLNEKIILLERKEVE